MIWLIALMALALINLGITLVGKDLAAFCASLLQVGLLGMGIWSVWK